ncbi:MAG: phosphomannomutase/phosphoglucomutase [Candidatus Paceibacterota bacterium]
MTFEHLKTIYRDFDIRGKYPEEITDEEVNKIAKALTKHFKIRKVAVGYDIRPSADALRKALVDGFVDSGVDVINIGLCTTPMSYYMCGNSDVDMTVMITASHMPSEYNGLKITVEDSKPVTGDILQIIREIVGTHTFSETVTRGSVTDHALQPEWIEKFKKRHNLTGAGFSIVVDPANMIGILEIDTFKAFEPNITVHTIFDTFDHTCPNHEANPLKSEVLAFVGNEVKNKKADLGVSFDGDADRVGFVDENGDIVPSDLIGALLARQVLEENKESTIVCDIRSSKALTEEIKKLKGKVVREKVGHTHIRSRMRKENAVLGIELSGHFFFKETFFSEGGALPAFLIMELMKKENKKLSELVAEVRKYYQSGEINSTVTRDIDAIYSDIQKEFPDMDVNRQDGLTLESADWWCNVRPSANDPVMRLNLEAKNKELMEEKRDVILGIIRRS